MIVHPVVLFGGFFLVAAGITGYTVLQIIREEQAYQYYEENVFRHSHDFDFEPFDEKYRTKEEEAYTSGRYEPEHENLKNRKHEQRLPDREEEETADPPKEEEKFTCFMAKDEQETTQALDETNQLNTCHSDSDQEEESVYSDNTSDSNSDNNSVDSDNHSVDSDNNTDDSDNNTDNNIEETIYYDDYDTDSEIPIYTDYQSSEESLSQATDSIVLLRERLARCDLDEDAMVYSEESAASTDQLVIHASSSEEEECVSDSENSWDAINSDDLDN